MLQLSITLFQSQFQINHFKFVFVPCNFNINLRQDFFMSFVVVAAAAIKVPSMDY